MYLFMLIMSWNVNGLRACEKKGFSKWLEKADPDLLGLQEIRAREDQLPKNLLEPEGRHAFYVPAQRPGYSGVGFLSKIRPDSTEEGLGIEEFDVEGRIQTISLGNLTIVNGYFPNGGGKEGDNSRVPYKLAFYEALLEKLKPAMKKGRKILVMGDFNTAHREIDLARPKDNRKTSGFLPEECEALDVWIESGWTDTFRHFEKEGGHYTWWSQRFGARKRNVGWRIDYMMASPAIMPYLKEASIHPDVMGSDHCPISVILDPEVLK